MIYITIHHYYVVRWCNRRLFGIMAPKSRVVLSSTCLARAVPILRFLVWESPASPHCSLACIMLQTVYTVPNIEGPVFLATMQEDVFKSGQFVKSSADKYTGQTWEFRSFEDEGGIPGDKVWSLVLVKSQQVCVG